MLKNDKAKKIFEFFAIPLVKAFTGCIVGGLVVLLWLVGFMKQ